MSARTTETTASTEPTRGRAATLLAPLRERSGVEIVEERLAPAAPFRFPWSVYEFLDVFPEAFREIPCALEPLQLTASERYDLVILAYQVWYLAPSIPTSSFLQSREAALLLDGTPVLTIVGCRNMWVRAHALVKNRVRAAKGRLVGHIVLTWLDSRWMALLQVGTAALIALVGVVLTVNAIRTVSGLS